MSSGSPSSGPDGSGNESELENESGQQGFAWMGTFLNVTREPVEAPAPPAKKPRARRPVSVASVLTGAALVLVAGSSAYAVATKDQIPPIVVGSASGGAPADKHPAQKRPVDDTARVSEAVPTPSAVPAPTAEPAASSSAAPTRAALAPASAGAAAAPRKSPAPAKPASRPSPSAAAAAVPQPQPTAPAARPQPSPAAAQPQPGPTAAQPKPAPTSTGTKSRPGHAMPGMKSKPAPSKSATAKSTPSPTKRGTIPGSSAKKAWEQAQANQQKWQAEAEKRLAELRKQSQREWRHKY